MPLIHTFTEQKLLPYQNPDDAKTVTVVLGNSLTLAAGTVLGRKTSDNKWYAYSNAASDGTEVARAILQYAIATDGSGNHFIGAAAVAEHGQFEKHAIAYMKGDFAVADLTGLDTAGLADMQGFLLFGDDLADAGAIVHIG
jgi:hypothetical protein